MENTDPVVQLRELAAKKINLLLIVSSPHVSSKMNEALRKSFPNAMITACHEWQEATENLKNVKHEVVVVYCDSIRNPRNTDINTFHISDIKFLKHPDVPLHIVTICTTEKVKDLAVKYGADTAVLAEEFLTNPESLLHK